MRRHPFGATFRPFGNTTDNLNYLAPQRADLRGRILDDYILYRLIKLRAVKSILRRSLHVIDDNVRLGAIGGLEP